jgi:hypothetical protein
VGISGFEPESAGFYKHISHQPKGLFAPLLGAYDATRLHHTPL